MGGAALAHFGLQVGTKLEVWDVEGLQWVTVDASAALPASVTQRSVFGRVKGIWGPEGFHLEARLAAIGNQAVFDDPWAIDLTGYSNVSNGV